MQLASALLLAADGVADEAIARPARQTPDTVRRRRVKSEAGGVGAVGSIAAGPGRGPLIAESAIEAIVDATFNAVPDHGSTQCSTHTMGERPGVGKDTVARSEGVGSYGLGGSTRSSCRPIAFRREAGRCCWAVIEPAPERVERGNRRLGLAVDRGSETLPLGSRPHNKSSQPPRKIVRSL
jgi:hypothetical protein